MKNTIINKLKLNNKKLIGIICLLIISLTMFLVITNKFNKYQVYDKKHFIGDRFYSYDDLYYINKVFDADETTKHKLIYSSIKHPLLVFNANKIAQFEEGIKNPITFNEHYNFVIILQIITSLTGIIFLFLILYDIFNLKLTAAFLLSLTFLFANSIIISTVLAESFIYSSTLLIINYYCLSKKKYILSGFLGVIIFGTTITNICAWGINCLALISFKDIKAWLKLIASFIISFLVVLGLVYFQDPIYTSIVYENFFQIVAENSTNFAYNNTLTVKLKMLYYYLLSSGLFYIDTVDTDQLGNNFSAAISFIPSANLIITFLTTAVYIPILSTLKKIDRNVIACFLILNFNIILHFGLKFGLYESFLYTPHFLFAIILLLGLSLKHAKKSSYLIYSVIFLILFCELLFNFRSVSDIIRIIGG